MGGSPVVVFSGLVQLWSFQRSQTGALRKENFSTQDVRLMRGCRLVPGGGLPSASVFQGMDDSST
jgi:hypothetical protein